MKEYITVTVNNQPCIIFKKHIVYVLKTEKGCTIYLNLNTNPSFNLFTPYEEIIALINQS